jgi:hypothetical protein
MALPLKDYREILIEVAVRSGLYDALNREDSCGDETWAQTPIAARVLDALGEVGLVGNARYGYHWIGEEPDSHVLQRWGQVRSWLGLAAQLSPWFHGKDIRAIDIKQERLHMTAAILAHWLSHQIRPQVGSVWLDIGGGHRGVGQRIDPIGRQSGGCGKTGSGCPDSPNSWCGAMGWRYLSSHTVGIV